MAQKKRRLRSVYDRFLRGVAVNMEEQLTAKLDERFASMEQRLVHTQLNINHNQLMLLDELSKRVKNSGTIALSETEIITKIFSGLKMYLDPRDLAITPHLALDSIWEHRITIAWLDVVRQSQVVLDIGSNNGYYGALAAQKSEVDEPNVVLFEANPHLIPYIRKTLAVNFLGNKTTLENVAVADRKGTLTLNVLKDYVGSSSVYSDEKVKSFMPNKWQVETEETIAVPAITIDEYCGGHRIAAVDLAIMDIEGYEDKAYEGMRQIVQKSPKMTLFVEFTPEAYTQPKAFYETMLRDFGYVYVIDEEGYIVQPSDTSFEGVIGERQDWVMPVFSKQNNLNKR